MAVTHNLSDVTNNLSGFDPVAGESDGTTIGRTWLLWKIFEAFQAFDPHVKMITASSPTPSFLQAEVGNLTSEPAKNASSANQVIRWYYDNDPGLSQSPQSAIIFEWGTTGDVSSNTNLIGVGISFKVDGDTRFVGVAHNQDGILDQDNNNTNSIPTPTTSMIGIHFFGSTTTVMNDIPKIIFWKSSNLNLVMSISKNDGSYNGYLLWSCFDFTGYRHNVGSITQGLDTSPIIFINANSATPFLEGFNKVYTGNFNSGLLADISVINSAGLLPPALFTFNAVNNLIGGNMFLALKQDASFKVITQNPLEGVLLAHPTPSAYNAGQIHQYNNKYYIHGNNISDGRVTHKMLFELGEP